MVARNNKATVPAQGELIFNLTKTELAALVQDAVKSVMVSQAKISENDLLTLDQLIQWTGYGRHTLYGLTSTGQIPFVKKRKKLYFSRKAIEQWIQSGNK